MLGHWETEWLESQVVTVWVMLPSFVQVMVVPTVMFLTVGTKPQLPEPLQNVPFQMITLGPLGAAGGPDERLVT